MLKEDTRSTQTIVERDWQVMNYGFGSEFTCTSCQASVLLSDRFCRQCGLALLWSAVGDSPPPNTSTDHEFPAIRSAPPLQSTTVPHPSRQLSVIAPCQLVGPSPGATVQGELIVGPKPVLIASDSGPIALLNHRSVVLGLLLFVGPVALPALWFSPTFSTRSKIVTSIIYLGLTILVPLAIMFYWLQIAIAPLMDILPTNV